MSKNTVHKKIIDDVLRSLEGTSIDSVLDTNIVLTHRAPHRETARKNGAPKTLEELARRVALGQHVLTTRRALYAPIPDVESAITGSEEKERLGLGSLAVTFMMPIVCPFAYNAHVSLTWTQEDVVLNGGRIDPDTFLAEIAAARGLRFYTADRPLVDRYKDTHIEFVTPAGFSGVLAKKAWGSYRARVMSLSFTELTRAVENDGLRFTDVDEAITDLEDLQAWVRRADRVFYSEDSWE